MDERFNRSNLSQASAKLFALRASIVIHAPIDRCFLLSTSVAIVHQELGMNAVGGRTEGLVREGDLIRWEGWQLGLRHHHVSQITNYHRPFFFQDRMVSGRFSSFEHDHSFRELDSGTLLEDELRFSMPYGRLGALVGRVVMVPHIRKLMRRRFLKMKGIAETYRWRQYLAQDDTSASVELSRE